MFKVGQAIEAKWIDKHYYPGTILAVEGNGMQLETQGNFFGHSIFPTFTALCPDIYYVLWQHDAHHVHHQ